MIENRGGLAILAGMFMVPSQLIGDSLTKSQKIIEQAVMDPYNSKIERFEFQSGRGILRGAIVYPKGWKPSKSSQCILYSNPNGMTISQYFENLCAPQHLFDIYKRPVIIYDYRGTGLSRFNKFLNLMQFRPTYQTVCKDGMSMIDFAFSRFTHVKVCGSSLGGGVSTIALEKYLKTKPELQNKVELLNHDSFTTTPRVVLIWQKIADFIGRIIGGMLDAETSMRKLIQKGVKITVLNHEDDPMIPKRARMSEFVNSLPRSPNVTVITSPYRGHANLSDDMIEQLQKQHSYFTWFFKSAFSVMNPINYLSTFWNRKPIALH